MNAYRVLVCPSEARWVADAQGSAARVRTFALRFVGEWGAVRAVLSCWAPDIVVLDLDGSWCAGRCRDDRAETGHFGPAFRAMRVSPAPVLLGVSSGEVVPSDLLVELARSGLARVVPPEVVRCPRRFREVLLDLLWSSLEAQVLRALQDSRAQPLAPDIRRYLEVGLRAERRLTSGEFARSVYASRSTIRRRLKGARLPALGTFVLRCRLIRVTALLQDPETSGEKAALLAGFYSGGHLSNLLRRHLGGGIGKARQMGVEQVAKALLL